MFSPIITRIMAAIVVFTLAYVNLMYFSDKLAKFIGYFGAMFLFPIVMAITVTYAVTLIKNTRIREFSWMYILNSFVSILPSIYLFLMLTFAEGL
jgi:hypothetical protein